MTKSDIFTGLKDILAGIKPKMDLSSVTLESGLYEDLGLDSLSMLLISLAIEQVFNVQMDGQVRFTEVGEVVDYVFVHQDNAF